MACASVYLRVWWKPRKALSAFSVTPHLILLRSGLSLNIEVAFSFQPAGSQQALLFPSPTGWGCSAILWVLGDELGPSLFTAESSLWLLFLVFCLQTSVRICPQYSFSGLAEVDQRTQLVLQRQHPLHGCPLNTHELEMKRPGL